MPPTERNDPPLAASDVQPNATTRSPGAVTAEELVILRAHVALLGRLPLDWVLNGKPIRDYTERDDLVKLDDFAFSIVGKRRGDGGAYEIVDATLEHLDG